MKFLKRWALWHNLKDQYDKKIKKKKDRKEGKEKENKLNSPKFSLLTKKKVN